MTLIKFRFIIPWRLNTVVLSPLCSHEIKAGMLSIIMSAIKLCFLDIFLNDTAQPALNMVTGTLRNRLIKGESFQKRVLMAIPADVILVGVLVSDSGQSLSFGMKPVSVQYAAVWSYQQPCQATPGVPVRSCGLSGPGAATFMNYMTSCSTEFVSASIYFI